MDMPTLHRSYFLPTLMLSAAAALLAAAVEAAPVDLTQAASQISKTPWRREV